MVDAIGGVEVCVQPIVDPKHGIDIPAGTRKLTGRTALNYVRARYTIGDKSDLGREKRQQAFVASMFRQVLSANTLADTLAVTGFLDSATKSLTLDQDLGSLRKLGALGYESGHIGLDRIQFLTTPVEDYHAQHHRLVSEHQQRRPSGANCASISTARRIAASRARSTPDTCRD